VKLAPSLEGSEEKRSLGVARASGRRDVTSGDRRCCQASQAAQGACVCGNEIQGAQGVENAEAMLLASGRQADRSDARYFFADVGINPTQSTYQIIESYLVPFIYSLPGVL